MTDITFQDAKVIQYKYAIYKIQSFIKFLKLIQLKQPKKCRKSDDNNDQIKEPHNDQGSDTSQAASINPRDQIVLCHYLTLLSGVIFSINEGIFNPKLELISQFKLFKLPPINISPMVSHIPYDINDSVVNPLIQLPSSEVSYKCVKLLETLYSQVLIGYEKRLTQMTNVIDAGVMTKIDEFLAEIVDGIDIQGSDEFLADALPDDSDEVVKEANLIDIDIKMIFVLTRDFTNILNNLKSSFDKFKLIKHQPASKQLKYLNGIPNNDLALYRLFILTLRLNDIYFIIRKFSRKIYLSNHLHLNDQKLVGRNQYFKSVIKGINDLFNGTKKNGVMIATITRFIRVNATFKNDVKNILDITSFVNQGLMIVNNNLAKLEEFGNLWSTNELKFRKLYNLPIANLVQLLSNYDNNDDEFPSIDEGYLDKRKEPNDRIFNRRSRSSSVSSNGSTASTNASATTTTGTSTASTSNSGGVARKSSINSIRTPPREARPNSMIFLNTNQISNVGRRRSNSQDDMYLNSKFSNLNIDKSQNSSASNGPLGASAAAAAIKKKYPSNLSSNSLTSNSNSNNVNDANNSSATSISPSSSRISKNVPIIEEEPNQIKKLTANQRLQQHIRQAAKSGSLMTQEKEIMTSVVYDPNNPNSINLKRYSDVSPPPSVSSGSSSSPIYSSPVGSLDGSIKLANLNGKPSVNGIGTEFNGKTAPLKRKTRDQVTKLNTKRNEVLSIDSESAISSSTTSSINPNNNINNINNNIINQGDGSLQNINSDGTVNKKVRFTGVPEWTESEDAPATYSSKILKNFAVFKNPALKRKDQQLKKEESLLFKQHINDGPLGNFQQAKLKIKTRLT